MIKWVIHNKTFPLLKKECCMRFNSPFTSITRLFLLIVIRKPLFALSLGHYFEYYLAMFIIRIVEDFDAKQRNEDTDLL